MFKPQEQGKHVMRLWESVPRKADTENPTPSPLREPSRVLAPSSFSTHGSPFWQQVPGYPASREHPRGGESPPSHTQHSEAAGPRVAQARHGQLQRREPSQAGAQGTGSQAAAGPPGMASRIDEPSSAGATTRASLRPQGTKAVIASGPSAGSEVLRAGISQVTHA